MSIEESNKLIASFDGFDFVTVGYYRDPDSETERQKANEEWSDKVGLEDVGNYIVNVPADKWHQWEDVAYHSSWKWLMPVWYKFIGLRFEAPMLELKHSEFKATIGHAILYGGIEKAHRNLSEGIQWYNNTQKHQQ